MIGKVHATDARIELKVRGANGRQTQVEAVIDTGFSGWLTLPKAMIHWLSLEWMSPGHAQLGDGRIAVFDVYEVAVVWHRRVLRIFVDESPSTPLIGMSLLKGSELKMQVCLGGKVSIRPLPTRRQRPR
jgi:clan AA aspartic protease